MALCEEYVDEESAHKDFHGNAFYKMHGTSLMKWHIYACYWKGTSNNDEISPKWLGDFERDFVWCMLRIRNETWDFEATNLLWDFGFEYQHILIE